MVSDGDSSLSGDSRRNDQADDRWGQTASIADGAGDELGNGGQIYAESYFWVTDQWGNWYVMIEIEQEGGSDDYFTFYTGDCYDVPPAGAVLTVHSECGVSGDWLKYDCLDGGDIPAPPSGSISGRLFSDSDGDATEWNGDANAWEDGVGGMTVTLYDGEGRAVATTTTDGWGNYRFEGLPEGEYRVKFAKPDGTEFVQKDVGSWGEDSDADANGLTDAFRLGDGEAKHNIDAGVAAPEPAAPSIDAADDRITVTESEGAGDVETLDSGARSILDNDTSDGAPYAGAVVEVNGAVGAVGSWIDLEKGRVKINADGTVDFDADGDFEALNAGESEEVSVEYTIRAGDAQAAVVATFEGPNGLTATATITELNGDLVVQLSLADGGDIGDIRGFFFDFADEALLDGLTVSGADVTGEKFRANRVDDLGHGANVKGHIVNEYGKFDGGVATGTPGIGSDDIRSTTITLSHESQALTLDLLTGQDMALRLTSVGEDGRAREDSLKLGATGVATTGGGVLDTATVTIEVQGEDEAPSIDAVDDFYVVDETEGAGDVEGNVLDNDVNLVDDTTTVLKVNGETANVGEWIDLAGGGRVRLTETGEIDFDADGDFDALNDGESATVDLTYTIAEVRAAAGEARTLSFDDLATGAVVTDQLGWAGVSVSSSSASHPVMVFDTANPTGGDWDLRTNNRGKVLILSEDGHGWDPDDNASGGTFIFEFDSPAHLDSLTFLDIEEGGAEIRFYGEDGGLIATVAGPQTADGGQATVPFDVSGVARMEVELQGSGAIDDLSYALGDGEEIIAEDTATVTIQVNGIDGEGDGGEQSPPEAVDDAFETDEETAVSGNVLDNDSDPDDDPISVVAVEGGTVGEAFQVTTAKGYTGEVTLNADGAFTFTPDDNFKALIQDEQDSFQLTYTIADDPEAAGKTNLLFVLDISNSTVGRTGDAQDIFDGVGVGDVNADGLADTVLDAEIAAVLNAVDKLLASGVDPSSVDVGIVTFSGLVDLSRFAAPYGIPTEDAAIVGTWQLDEAALIQALTDIASGGWTNYEAGLQQAEDWLSANADAGEANKVFFLSDGRPVIDKVYGHDVLQDMSDYGDEVSRIADDYGAEIHAIGVGANSDLGYLNGIDNTGGAVQVLDTNDLTVTLEDLVVAPLTDTATITVTINGLNQPPVAEDDAQSVDEDGVIGVAGGDDVTASLNILDNDSDPDGDAISIAAIAGGVVGSAFAVTTAGGKTVSVTVSATGDLFFDTAGLFDDLDAGETDSFTLSYTLSDGNGGTDDAVVTITINGLNEPPTATDNLAETDEGVAVSGNVITDDDGFGVDSDPNESDTLTVTAVSFGDVGVSASVISDGGRSGELTVNQDGGYTFVPGADFDELLDGETDAFTFEYTISDGQGGTDSALVTITVNGQGVPPIAENDGVVITEIGGVGPDAGGDGGPEVSLNILANDSDPDGAAGDASDLTITTVGGVAPGEAFDVTSTDGRFTTSVTVNADGEVFFDAGSTFGVLETGEFARLQFDYTVVDADGLTDDATVTIDIIGDAGNVVEQGPSFNIFFMVDLSASATTAGAVTDMDADFFQGGAQDLNGDGYGATQADAAFVAIQDFQAALLASGLASDVDLGVGTFAHSTGQENEFQLITNSGEEFIFDLEDNISNAFSQAQGLGDAAFLGSAYAGANEFFAASGGADEDAINLFYVISDGALIVTGAQQTAQVPDPVNEILGLLNGLGPETELVSIGANGGASTYASVMNALTGSTPATTSAFSREEIALWAAEEANHILTLSTDSVIG